MANTTKVVTGVVRLSYAHVWEPNSINGGTPKYSVSLIIAYWFRHDLERINKRFNVREIKSSQDINDWNNGRISIAVIHPATVVYKFNAK